MRIKTLLGIFLATMILVLSFQTANATLGVWDLKVTANIKGNSLGYAGKMVRKLGTGQWSADIVSYTDLPPVVITLGWTYFTARETCNGVITQQVIKGGTSVSGTQIATGTFMTPRACSGTRYGYSIGKHELKGSKTWTPEWSHGDVVP